MSLTLYYHPLSSYCQKVITALYEKDISFARKVVDLTNPDENAQFKKVWPIGKFPVLRDDERGQTVPESTIIIEYLESLHPGKTRLIPADAAEAVACRLFDRFMDLHVHNQMQKIVGDKLRPEGLRDPEGVRQARATLQTAYGILESQLDGKQWALGDAYSMGDCAASPALFFASRVEPFSAAHPRLASYFQRLSERPSFARSTSEAAPFMKHFPG